MDVRKTTILRSLLLVPLFLLSKYVNATTIVVIVTSSFVLLGVDSKLTIEITSGGTKDSTAVKMYQVGDYFFATQGVRSILEPDDQFAKIIWTELGSEVDINLALTSANGRLKKALTNQADIIRRRWPNYYEAEYVHKEYIFSYAVVGIKESVPFGYQASFITKVTEEDYNLSIEDTYFPKPTSTPTDAKAFYIGEHEAIDEYMKDPENVAISSPDTLIVKLFDVQIKATPTTVGPPINVVKMTKAGDVTWIMRADECPASF